MIREREVVTSLAMVLALGVATAVASPPQPSMDDSEIDTCPADVNEDGYIGFEDLLAVLFDWGDCPIVDDISDPNMDDQNGKEAESRECSRADVDGNQSVGIGDLLLVLDSFSFHCNRLNGG